MAVGDDMQHFFPNEKFTDLTIYQFGRQAAMPGYKNILSFNHFIFHYIYSGKGTLSYRVEKTAKIQSFPVEANQGFMMWPGINSTYQASEDDPWEYSWIEFEGSKAKELVFESGLNVYNPIYSSNDANEREKMASALSYITNNPKDPPLVLMSHFNMFMHHFVTSSDLRKHPEDETLQEFYVRSAIDYINKNYMNDITVCDISKYCSLHRSYLHRIFKAVLQTTPQNFLIQCRIDNACRLLRTTSNTVKEISALVGYPNEQNFSRAFMRTMGLSPSNWRKEN